MEKSQVPAYDFLAPPRIVFGWGRRAEAGSLGRTLGNRGFLICGSRALERAGEVAALTASFAASGRELIRLTTISREPQIEDVDRTFSLMLERGEVTHDFLVALGGGSAIDLAKAVAALATNRQGSTVADFLEGVEAGLNIQNAPLPVLAMPTTAGTGSEATKNAVIASSDPPFKKSLRSELMIPRIVLVDPGLTAGLPQSITAQTGMDAITQLIESYISRRAKPISDAFCLQGIELAMPAIVEAFEDGTSPDARTRMSHAALLSGLALANSGLGFAHGVAAALGVHHSIPHGLACAVMLPAAMKVNRETSAPRMAVLGRIMTQQHELTELDAANAAIETIQQTCDRLRIPRRLSELGVSRGDLRKLAADSRGNSMSGNPRELSDDEIHGVLEAML